MINSYSINGNKKGASHDAPFSFIENPRSVEVFEGLAPGFIIKEQKKKLF